MTKLYPLKFNVQYRDKIWGGDKIKTVLGKNHENIPNCGETWEISGVKGYESIVSEGELKGKSLSEIFKIHGKELVGEHVFKNSPDGFPLLIKFISAADNLSIQVHPDDELAKKRHNSLGKSEMWYIIDAEENSTLISGFNKALTKQEYCSAFENGNLMEILNVVNVKKGDCFYLPSGRIHSIGSGILLAEIQQSSDITYRTFDFNRKDENGNERELHVKDALDAIDFTYTEDVKSKYKLVENKGVKLVENSYFTSDIIKLSGNLQRDFSTLDSFVIYICVEGSAKINCGDEQNLSLKLGECLLIPACLKNAELNGNATLLEVYVT